MSELKDKIKILKARNKDLFKVAKQCGQYQKLYSETQAKLDIAVEALRAYSISDLDKVAKLALDKIRK